MKILIVEDEHKIARVVARALEQENYAVDIAYDGDEGYSMATTEPYDLAIIDRMIPGDYDGIAIVKAMREAKIHTPVLHEQDKDDNHDERYARIEKLAQLDGIEAELEEKKEIFRKAQPYPKTNRLGSLAVTIGSVVELIDQAGRKYVYTIVNSVEANPSDGRISFKSPLGQSLLGKKIKDTVEWQMRNRKFRLTRIS